ncbi:MAG: DUF1559 domain-containing protein [Armatimonadota bacterium]|nr:DUF1559 domain-containing protein [Armatimonadota bacterium]
MIAILAAILFPVFTRAREQARRASCVSNLKQLALATLMYCQDYDDTFPACCIFPPGVPILEDYGYPCGWTMPPYFSVPFKDTVTPYVKNEQIWLCPTGAKIEHDFTVNTLGGNSYFFMSVPPLLGPMNLAGTTLASVVHDPARVVMLLDTVPVWHSRNPHTCVEFWQTQAQGQTLGGIWASNFAFVDGHAKTYTFTEFEAYWSIYEPAR